MTNPSETKLVERGVKMLTEEHLAKAICLYNGIALQGPDGSEQWWPFCSDAKRMLANADGELESALASLADELRLARERVAELENWRPELIAYLTDTVASDLLVGIEWCIGRIRTFEPGYQKRALRAEFASIDAASSGPKD